MITELEIFRAANTLVKRYGQDAELEAAKQADAMIERGEGFQGWGIMAVQAERDCRLDR